MEKSVDFVQSKEDMAVVERMLLVQAQAVADEPASPLVITPNEAISLVNLAHCATLRQEEVAAIVALLETMALLPAEFWTLVRNCTIRLGQARMRAVIDSVFSHESEKWGVLHADDILRLIPVGDEDEVK